MENLENKLRGPKTLGCVWFLGSTKERKKKLRKMIFFIFNCLIKNLSVNEVSLSG